MKINTPTFTKIALASLLAGSLFACNNPKTESKTAATPVASEANKETIVYINQDTLLSKYDYAKDANKSIQEKAKAAQSDVQSRGQAFQREYADYQKNVNTMPADQRQTTEQRLQREQQDLQSYQQNATAAFQTEQSTEAGKVYDKLADFAKAYAKEKGYKMVLMYTKANPTILYGDQSLDVTADAIKQLNDQYAKEKK